MPDELREHLRLIVVDDGSTILQADEQTLPEYAVAAKHEDIGMPFELYRLTVNIRWNQDACRNLAVDKARTDWVLLTDIDHLPPVGTLRALVLMKLDEHRVYNFTRVTLEKRGTLSDYHPHPNSWFLTRAAYRRIGGYDERFAGLYGTDADFKERVAATFGDPIRLDLPLIRVPRDTIPDASTTTYFRKEKCDEALKVMRKQRNLTPGWQPIRLSFPWERIA
jgi:hypothetical protein